MIDLCYSEDSVKSRVGFGQFSFYALKEFGFNEIVSTEKHDSALQAILDFAAIDAVVKNKRGTFGIASRVSFGKNYSTVTIRRSRPNGAETEYAKILRAMASDGLKPKYHCQAYVGEDEKSAIVAITLTVEQVHIIKLNPSRWRTNKDGETFFYTPFNELDCLQVYRVDAGGKHVENITNQYATASAA